MMKKTLLNFVFILLLLPAIIYAQGTPAGSGSGSAGTQYTEGDTDASITGNAMMWEDAADTLVPVSAAKPLPISLTTQLDPTNDGITIYGSDDGGTTKRIINTNSAGDVAGVGGTGDAAATAGSTGSVNAKLRLMSQQLEDIKTAVQLIDNDQTGASVKYVTSAGSTEDETEIKATAGRLFSVTITNTNAAVRYWRCSNLTAANTTPGTSTVLIGGAIPGATTGAGITASFGPKGIAFSTALTCWFVTGAADSDVAEVAANEIKAMFVYE